MLINEYDRVVDFIENNITLEKKKIESKVNQMLGMTDRRAGEFFIAIDSEGRTVKQYIRDRKVIRALEDFLCGETAEIVAERYGLSDPTAFSTSVKALTGSSPKVLRQEGFKCPKPRYLRELLDESEGRNNTSKENADIEKFKYEINKLIDENENLKNRVAALTMEDIKLREKTDSPDDVTLNSISISSYKKFLEVENCRVSYGFSVKHILKLYEESLEKGMGLEKLCEEALYSFRFDLKNDDTSDHDIERLGYHLEYEMDPGEAFNYYYGDDDVADMEIDPYAGDYDAKAEYDISDVELEEYSNYDENEEDNDWVAPDPRDLGIEVDNDLLDDDGNPIEFA